MWVSRGARALVLSREVKGGSSAFLPALALSRGLLISVQSHFSGLFNVGALAHPLRPVVAEGYFVHSPLGLIDNC